MSLKSALASVWRTLSRPAATISLGVLTFGGFIAGIFFWGGFNTAMEVANTEKFCITCHEMRDNVYAELQETVHWENRTGVRATCPDCHVPHEWTNKVARKMQASKEVWGALFGTIDTPEKFAAKRKELARHEWARLEANGSLECRNCHDYDSMDWEKMSDEAVFYMKPAAKLDTACINCHKGIAHHLPESSGESPILVALGSKAVSNLKEGEDYYAIDTIALFEDEAMTRPAGVLELGAAVKVVASQGDKLQVRLDAWRKDKGFGRVLYDDFGLNMRKAILAKETATNAGVVQASQQRNDDNTGLDWSQVSVDLWAEARGFVDAEQVLWDVASKSYASGCSTCHAQPDPEHFSANAWPAMFNGMVGFTNFDETESKLVLTYLQKHSSDFVKAH